MPRKKNPVLKVELDGERLERLIQATSLANSQKDEYDLACDPHEPEKMVFDILDYALWNFDAFLDHAIKHDMNMRGYCPDIFVSYDRARRAQEVKEEELAQV